MWYISKEDYIAHYGVGHLNGGNSGRYPWGSGERPYQGAGGRVTGNKKNGIVSKVKSGFKKAADFVNKEVDRFDADIAKDLGIKDTNKNNQKKLATGAQKKLSRKELKQIKLDEYKAYKKEKMGELYESLEREDQLEIRKLAGIDAYKKYGKSNPSMTKKRFHR